jgi:TetR/AcrR family transcriptional repressor of mexCD-oprJ operon
LLLAAHRELPPDRIHAHHHKPMCRVRTLIEHSQRADVFRTDLPTPWLVATFYCVLHAAADEINAGHPHDRDAPAMITATLPAVFTPSGAAVPPVPADRHDGQIVVRRGNGRDGNGRGGNGGLRSSGWSAPR